MDSFSLTPTYMNLNKPSYFSGPWLNNTQCSSAKLMHSHLYKILFSDGSFLKWKLSWNESSVFNTCGPVEGKQNVDLSFKTGFKAFSKNQDIHKTVFYPLPLNSTKSMFSYRIGSPVTKASSSQPWGCDTLLCQLCY